MASIVNVTFGARDPEALARFWAAALGYVVIEARPRLVRLAPPDGTPPHLLFLPVDEPGRGANRVHLDLSDPVVGREVARLVALGATLVDGGAPDAPRWRRANRIDWVVLADPEGNELCLGHPPDGDG